MKNQLTSNRLNVNAGIMSWYVKELKELKKLTKRMTKECLERLSEVYKQGYTQISLDESISSQARIALNELNRKYSDKFSDEAKELVQKLLTKTNKYSTWQFTKSLSHFDKTLYNISFKQIQEVTPVYVTMKNASNASNTSRVNSGVKQAKTVEETRLRKIIIGH